MFKYKNSSGFTLIELMIATALLSMIMFVGSYSYSSIMGRWQKELGSFSEVVEFSTNIQRLQSLLENLKVNVVVQGNGLPSFFFVGTESSLFAITSNGLFDYDEMEVFRLSTIKNKDDKISLVYQSKKIGKDIILTANQEVEFERELILLKEFDEIEFKYFGWQNIEEKNKNIAPTWTDSYSGIDRQLTPEKIAIHLKKTQKELELIINLSNDNSRWLSPYFDKLEE